MAARKTKITTYTRRNSRTFEHDPKEKVTLNEPNIDFNLPENGSMQKKLWVLTGCEVDCIMIQPGSPRSPLKDVVFQIIYGRNEYRGDERKGEARRFLDEQNVNAVELRKLFGVHVLLFVMHQRFALIGGLSRSLAERLGLSESYGDENKYYEYS